LRTNSGDFSVGIGSQRATSSKIALSVVSDSDWDYFALIAVNLVQDLLLPQRGAALHWR
jgi:hypothetical protein